MTYFLPCPVCNQSLYLPDNSLEEDLEIVCHFCQSKYSAIYGKVCKEMSSLSAPPFYLGVWTKSGKHGFAELKKSEVEALRLDNNDKLILLSGIVRKLGSNNSFADWLISFFPLLPSVQSKTSPVTVIKRNTGNVFELSSRVKTSPISLFFACATATPIFSLMLFPANPFSLISLIFSSIPIAITTWYGVNESKKIFKEPNNTVFNQLVSEQQLLVQKFKLEKRVNQLVQEIQSLEQTAEHLQSLHQQMIGVTPDVYAKRCEIVTRSMEALKVRISRLGDLVTSYNYLAKMIAIEYKASRLAGRLLNNITTQLMVEESSEIKLLKFKQQELASRISLQQQK